MKNRVALLKKFFIMKEISENGTFLLHLPDLSDL